MITTLVTKDGLAEIELYQAELVFVDAVKALEKAQAAMAAANTRLDAALSYWNTPTGDEV